MSILFSPCAIKNIEIRNRFVRSATYEGMGTPDWLPSSSLATLYCKLADAEIGIIITGGVLVDRMAPIQKAEWGSMQTAMDDDACLEHWRRITDAVKDRGARIIVQFYHPGRRLSMNFYRSCAVAPSERPNVKNYLPPRALSIQEIQELVEKFAQAILRARMAGFDGVQLHACHGVLLSDFISPFTNFRADQYGGNTENRARFVVDILKRARELAGNDFPLLIKMNCDDFVPGGLEIDEATRIAKIVAHAGVDCIEVTGGIPESTILVKTLDQQLLNGPKKEAYFRSFGAAIRKEVNVPVILVGGLRTPSVMEKMLEEGMADFIALSRPLIREPDLLKRWKAGDRSKSTCISCSRCYQVLKRPLRCYVTHPLEKQRQEKASLLLHKNAP